MSHVRGERHPLAKLTTAQVRDIRSEYRAGTASVRQLAEQNKVSSALIHRIIQHVSWPHITD